ncbi:unnamed protein product [Parnassius mnemosyne]
MNVVNFNKWLREKLIPNSNEPSVLVMDSASYHSIIVNKAPTSQSRKNDIREWLTLNDIPFEQNRIKAELLCLVKRNTPEPVYEADELLKQNGHEFTLKINNKERDRITEDNLESFIIHVADSDSSGSNESFHIETLDSDFDYGSE